jgi:hypothetical protein
MAPEAAETDTHLITRMADSSEDLVRDLVALPLRMLAGGLGIFEALLRTAADAISEDDPDDAPADDRVVELERRVESLEEQLSGSGATVI